MTLRLRLAITTVAVTLPMIAGLVLADLVARRRAAERELADLAFGQVDAPGARERCESAGGKLGMPSPSPSRDGPRGGRPDNQGDHAPPSPDHGPPPPDHTPPPDHDPRHPGGPPPGPPPGLGDRPMHRRPAELFVYDEAFRPHDPAAPALDADLARQVREHDVAQSTAGAARWLSSDVEIVLATPWAEGDCAYVVARGTSEPWLGAILPATRIWLAPVGIVFVVMLVAVGPAIRRLRRLTASVRRQAAAGYEGGVAMAGADEIGELARAFDAAGGVVRAQLAEKDRRERALREFLANTTHDVMIPLTVLSGHLAGMRDRVAAGQPVEAPTLASAMEEAHYLASLIHNLAAAAKLDAAEPALQPGPVDLAALVTRVVARHAPIARQRQVALDAALPDEPTVVDADVTLLEQAVSNVVWNAIRHNRAGGHAAVILERRGAGFRLRVLDDGPGIPAADLGALTERGFRGDAARGRDPGGAGIGLAITRRVAELHHLSLSFATPDAGGLEVTLEPAPRAS